MEYPCNIECFQHHSKFSCAPSQSIYTHHPQATSGLIFFHLRWLVFVLELITNIIIHMCSLCKTSFAQENVFEIHPCCRVLSDFHPFLLLSSITKYDYIHSLLTHFRLTTPGLFPNLGCLEESCYKQFYAGFCGNRLSFLLGKYQGVDFLCPRVRCMVHFMSLSELFPK